MQRQAMYLQPQPQPFSAVGGNATTSAITTTEHALELRSDHSQLSSRDGDL
jgi:hypothetical protein